MARVPGNKGGFDIKAGIPAALAVLFSFVWLGLLTTSFANQVQSGGLGQGALGEMIPLLAGIPILVLSLSRNFSLTAIGVGFGALAGLFLDSIAFQNSLVSNNILAGLQTLSTTSTNSLQFTPTPQSLVFTIGTFAVAEEMGFGVLARTILDSVFGLQRGKPGYVLGGIGVSAIVGIFFDMWHLFVTVPLYSQLLNAPPVGGFLNLAILFTPFSLSAIVARIILDTSNRVSGDYISGIVGHAGFDMILTALALRLI